MRSLSATFGTGEVTCEKPTQTVVDVTSVDLRRHFHELRHGLEIMCRGPCGEGIEDGPETLRLLRYLVIDSGRDLVVRGPRKEARSDKDAKPPGKGLGRQPQRLPHTPSTT